MATISVVVTATDKNGQRAQSTGGSVIPGSAGVSTSIQVGETTILPVTDTGNGNLLIAQPITLTQAGTLQSLSFYVATIGGQLRLGVYSDSSGPSNKLAETAAFTPVTGWNTQSTLTTPVLQPGTYWIAYLPQLNTLKFQNGPSIGNKFKSFAFGVMPVTFPASPSSDPNHFSFYSTFTAPGTPTNTVWVNSNIPIVGFAVVLSGTSLSNLGAQNKGGVIGAVTVVNGTQTTPVVIGGPDAAKFALTNGGIVPCNLIAAVDTPAGSYSITLSAT